MSEFERFEQRLAELTAAVGRIAPPPARAEEEGPTFGDLAAARIKEQPEWALAYARRLRPVLAWFDCWPALSIGIRAWSAYSSERKACRFRGKGRVTAMTVNLELAMLRSTYVWALDREMIPHNPAARIKPERCRSVPQVAVREEHGERMLRVCRNKMERAYVLVGFDAGPRQDEIRNIRWSQIDVETREISLTVTKGGKPRVIVVTTRALDALLKLPRVDGSPYVFVNVNTKKRFSGRSLARWMARIARESGVELEFYGRMVRSHALRHSYATHAVERGVNLKSLQMQMGHSSLAMTDRYVASRSDWLRAAADVFEAGIAKRRGPHRAGSGVADEAEKKYLASAAGL